MPPIIITVLQGLFLLLLYVFIGRTVRWIIKDLSSNRTAVTASTKNARRTVKPRPRQEPRQAPREIVVHPPEGAPHVLPLEEAAGITFGRHDTATVYLDDPYASDNHARIYHNGSNWLIADEGSTNGTYLNQARLTTPTAIKAGDQISIGRTTVEVRR